MDDSAEAPITHEPLAAADAVPAATDAQVLGRYRPLQVASIALMLAGLAGLLLGVNLAPLTGSGSGLPTSEEATLALAAVTAGALALVVGLITNAVRAMVVRERLPANRYRGPSIIVLLLIATVVTIALVTPYFAEIQRFTTGKPTRDGVGSSTHRRRGRHNFAPDAAFELRDEFEVCGSEGTRGHDRDVVR